MKLKIAIVVTYFPTLTETFILNHIVNLKKRGHDVKIFSLKKGDFEKRHYLVDDFKLLENVCFYKDQKISFLKTYITFLTYFLKNFNEINIRKFLKNFNPLKRGISNFKLKFFTKGMWILNEGPFNIIHSHYGVNGKLISELKASGFLDKSLFVNSFHGYDINPKLINYYRSFYKTLFSELDLAILNSKYSLNLLNQINSSQKSIIIPVGVDLNKFSYERAVNRSDFHVLFVGRLITLKGPEIALEIFKQLKNEKLENIYLHIVGKGPLQLNIEKLLEDLDLNNSVNLHGALTHDDLIKLMKKSDVLIMPGIYDADGRVETQGVVIQEAQAMGMPVLVSDVGGMKYGLLNNRTGYILSCTDTLQFTEKIKYLYSNRDIAWGMGEKAREYVERYYDATKLNEKLERIYLSEIKNRNLK